MVEYELGPRQHSTELGPWGEPIQTMNLYFPATREAEDKFTKMGYAPQTDGPLRLSTSFDAASGEAQSIDGVVMMVQGVPVSHVKVDPEMGTEQDVKSEYDKSTKGQTGYLILFRPLPFQHFRRYHGSDYCAYGKQC